VDYSLFAAQSGDDWFAFLAQRQITKREIMRISLEVGRSAQPNERSAIKQSYLDAYGLLQNINDCSSDHRQAGLLSDNSKYTLTEKLIEWRNCTSQVVGS
jgi:hypothetical protein